MQQQWSNRQLKRTYLRSVFMPWETVAWCLDDFAQAEISMDIVVGTESKICLIKHWNIQICNEFEMKIFYLKKSLHVYKYMERRQP
jgi:hypothetical protein